ncbi:uncharacterized protein [Palaemon carinicauda]|uniref:uncharacterized protein n=1 Tax=Palaemon carinicauda TaxID=392227 RepID=UPI0035B62054
MELGAVHTIFMVWAVLVLGDSADCVPLPESLSRNISPRSRGLNAVESTAPNDYSDAIYAAKFAIELSRLEKQQKEVYDDFISAGFIEDEVPRDLPSHLQPLSRSSSSVGFRFPSEGEVLVNRARAIGSAVPSGFTITPRPFLAPNQYIPGPAFNAGFRTVTPFPRVLDPGTLFAFNHRLGAPL